MSHDTCSNFSQQPFSGTHEETESSSNRVEGDTDAERSARRAEELEAEYEKQQKSKQGSLPLQRELAPPKPFPFDLLGPLLGPVAKRIHEVVKSPDSICGQSILAAAALMVQPYADISIDGRVHPLSLFLVTAGESGDRKSAVDAIALKAVRDYEKMLAKAWIGEKSAYKNKSDCWGKQREQVMRENKANEIESALGRLDPEPPRPLEPFLLLEEPSYEGLVKLFGVGQPGLGLFSDEGGRMFGGYAMSRDNVLKTACGLSSLWDGKPITRIRGGDDNLLLYGRRFSMHLMVQEVVLSELFKNEILIGQGLLARCLLVSPLTNAGGRPYNPIDISKDPLITSFWARTATLLDQPFPLANPDTKNELNPRPLILSPEAKALWVLFHDDVDRSLRPEGAYRAIRRTANKAAEQALRVAGVLTLVEDFEAGSVSAEGIEKAIELIRFYLDEIMRVSEMTCADPDLELAQAVLNWMKMKAAGNPHRVFPLAEIYQKAGPRGVRNKKMADKVMGILQEHREVVRVAQDKSEWRLNGISTG